MKQGEQNKLPAQLGLVLSGGGSRGAYQAGVMKAIAEISKGLGLAQPFPIVTGVSAGAINAAFWAAHADNISEAAEKLCELWSRVTFDQVFRSGIFSMGKISSKWIVDVSLGGLTGVTKAESLLDTAPLRELLRKNLDFNAIQKNLEAGHLSAISVTATDYGSTNSVTFVQSARPAPMWTRQQRYSVQATLSVDHIMASSAVPLFFPSSPVGESYFGDGCLRNTAPLSPAIHLGADKLLVVGVRKQPPTSEITQLPPARPSIARVLSVVLNAIILDGVDWDIERLSRVNNTVRAVPEEKRANLPLRPIDYLWLYPSEDIGKLAQIETRQLPSVIRYLMKGLGPLKEASGIASYLLFDPVFCGQLIDMGYNDTIKRRSEIESFFLR
ncbi:MAG TPA: patatin-like phospholipase family protein [Bdellovibrionales bacterium]|nr:patatin-like phospholipase family protein [Bdellovibrionales bacterium]